MALRFRSTRTFGPPAPFDEATHRLVEDSRRRFREVGRELVSPDADQANRDWLKIGKGPGQEASERYDREQRGVR